MISYLDLEKYIEDSTGIVPSEYIYKSNTSDHKMQVVSTLFSKTELKNREVYLSFAFNVPGLASNIIVLKSFVQLNRIPASFYKCIHDLNTKPEIRKAMLLVIDNDFFVVQSKFTYSSLSSMEDLVDYGMDLGMFLINLVKREIV